MKLAGMPCNDGCVVWSSAHAVVECCKKWCMPNAPMGGMQAWDGGTLAAGYQGMESASDGMVLITVLLCTLVRGAKLQEAKVGNFKGIATHDVIFLRTILWCSRQALFSQYPEICGRSLQTRAVALLSRAAAMCDDDTRLQRVVPYLLVRSLPHTDSPADELPLSNTVDCTLLHAFQI